MAEFDVCTVSDDCELYMMTMWCVIDSVMHKGITRAESGIHQQDAHHKMTATGSQGDRYD